MSTHKNIDKICRAAFVFTLLLTALLVLAGMTGRRQEERIMGYEDRLFDTSSVHTIDIVMDDWDGFLDSCENEEYALCAVVIDQEPYQNVGIRAKGNTSLRNVSAMDSDRYSFKIEFDQYETGKSYHGLDKLSLNNIIQDHTYMKDFMAYQMMASAGVDTPLCSYVYITVNGEDWGLYLAVEGVEESFLERNYGSRYGELYKPDSMDMGGGPGNGGKFDWEQFRQEQGVSADGAEPEKISWPQDMPDPPAMPEPGQTDRPDAGGQEEIPEWPNMAGMPEQQDRAGSFVPEDRGEIPSGQEVGAGMPDPEEKGGIRFGPAHQNGENGMPGGPGGNSNDVKLLYSDDDPDSYPNIFENAKTDVTQADQNRLITSLKQLNAMENIPSVVDVEAVIRYFVVHNFVCNFDSYTGTMIHNYYLYEEDGRLSMIPWDYNLAFGTFAADADAEEMVNYPIDDPVSGGELSSRPMLAWIFADAEYTRLYHQIFEEWISDYFESGRFAALLEETAAMIGPYVEKDPTKFCTYEEFETGVAALREFCLLRAESVRGQLDGTIPATADGQRQDSTALITAEGLSLADMGTMEMGR